MMNILFSPRRDDRVIIYEFNSEFITVTIGEITDTFDFSVVPNGVVDVKSIETTLPINPIRYAERVDGVLNVEVLHFHGENADVNERYPDWQVIE